MYITKFHGIVDRHVQQRWRRKHLMTSKIFQESLNYWKTKSMKS